MDEYTTRRTQMVERQIRGRGIKDEAVIAAMLTVPRHLFVTQEYKKFAYDDRPLPIGTGQTISQPYIVALVVEQLHLQRSDKVLEVGAGSGYAAAILSEVADHVYAIERIPMLADFARQNLRAAGYVNVEIRCADGTEGWPAHAPFDAILVSAGAKEKPSLLLSQLAIGGRLIVPIGTYEQELMRFTRLDEEKFHIESLASVQFVPLISDDPE